MRGRDYVTVWDQPVSVSISLPSGQQTDGSALILASNNMLIMVWLSTMNFPRPAHPSHITTWLTRVLYFGGCRSNALTGSETIPSWSDRPPSSPPTHFHTWERTMASPDVTSWKDSSFMRRIRSFVPVGYKEEVIKLSKLAGPVVSHPSVFQCLV